MAMKPCRECGQEVSTKAKTCPNCGVKRPGRRTAFAALATWFLDLPLLRSPDPEGEALEFRANLHWEDLDGDGIPDTRVVTMDEAAMAWYEKGRFKS